MARIVLVGAGSVEFTRNLLGDILSSPALRSSDIALHDIDPDRLRTAERMAHWTADALGANPTVTAHLDRREALEGAQFVVNTIQVGGARATRVDFDVRRQVRTPLHDRRHDRRRRRVPRASYHPRRAGHRPRHGRRLP